MRTTASIAAALGAAATLGLAACEQGGTSTAEMKTAAIEHARQELGLAANVPLNATVWVGPEQHREQAVLCGTVSDETPGTRVPPKRFAATGDPIEWLIFEDAHDAMIPAQPDKFPEWGRLCGRGRS